MRTLHLLHGHDDDPTMIVDWARRFRVGSMMHRGPLDGPSGGFMWFDPEDPGPGLVHAVDRLLTEVAANDGIVGYSQGGAVALAVAARTPVVAVACVAGFAPDGLDPAALAGTTVLVAHGADDETVPALYARSLVRALDGAGVAVTFHEYDGMGHAPTDACLDDLAGWVARL